MSISVGAVASAQTYTSLFQTKPANGGGKPDAADALTALLRLDPAPQNQTNSANSSPPAGGSNGAQFSPGIMNSLLAAQGQQTGDGAAAAPGTDSSNRSSSDAQGATTTVTTNPDGSMTTTTTFADGTVKTVTMPASSIANDASKGASQGNGASGQGDADQLLKVLAQGIQALAPAAALLAVL
ncbi:MAG TPA: hypothetical protein VFS63_09450 [Pseudolabrys sp.]|jgi:hypothetical protein|nr:hypothetical protein [Pseudolabrys sp.]